MNKIILSSVIIGVVIAFLLSFFIWISKFPVNWFTSFTVGNVTGMATGVYGVHDGVLRNYKMLSKQHLFSWGIISVVSAAVLMPFVPQVVAFSFLDFLWSLSFGWALLGLVSGAVGFGGLKKLYKQLEASRHPAK